MQNTFHPGHWPAISTKAILHCLGHRGQAGHDDQQQQQDEHDQVQISGYLNKLNQRKHKQGGGRRASAVVAQHLGQHAAQVGGGQ